MLENLKNKFYRQEYYYVNKKSLKKEKKVYVTFVQNHGNLGDQALTIATEKFLSDYLPDYAQVELTISNLNDAKFLEKLQFQEEDIFVIQGGGFLGNIWLEPYEVLCGLIEKLTTQKIIIFPQSSNFRQDDEGKVAEQRFLLACNNKNITIFLRDQISYDYMKEHFPKLSIELSPDIAFYLFPKDMNLQRNKKVLFLIRQDRERKISQERVEQIKQIFMKRGYKIEVSDTVISKRIFKSTRNKELNKKLKQISTSEIVVTDRLHGMIFCYLTHTKCLVFSNNNHKIKGAYQWISNCSYIHYMEEEQSLEKNIEQLEHVTPKGKSLQSHYSRLVTLVKESIKCQSKKN